jgi:hypothetical protein
LSFIKDRPSAVHSAPCPLPAKPKPDLRHRTTTSDTRSALVVPPDFDGLLHDAPCESIAPRYRPWGSPCFQPDTDVPCFPRRRQPSEAFPSLVAVSISPSLLPSRCCPDRAFTGVATNAASCRFSTSGFCSTKESVAPRHVATSQRSMLPWALPLVCAPS